MVRITQWKKSKKLSATKENKEASINIPIPNLMATDSDDLLGKRECLEKLGPCNKNYSSLNEHGSM